MKTIRVFLSENFQFLVVKFSLYLNRSVFVMGSNAVPLLQFLCVRVSMVSYGAFVLSLKHRLWALVKTASPKRF